MVAPITLSPGRFVTGTGSPRQHGLVDGAAAFEDNAVHGEPSRRDGCAVGHRRARGSVERPTRCHRPRCDGPFSGASPSSDLMAAEVCDRAFSSSICPSSVSEMMTAAASKRRRSARGLQSWAEKLQRHRRDHAVHKRRPGADADQGPHVRTAMDQRLPASSEEGPTGPWDDRQRQHELQPALLSGVMIPNRWPTIASVVTTTVRARSTRNGA